MIINKIKTTKGWYTLLVLLAIKLSMSRIETLPSMKNLSIQ